MSGQINESVNLSLLIHLPHPFPDKQNQVKLYWMGSLSCHGYLIDELWLISSSECFLNKTRAEGEWTAEISYEHYGNDDYKNIETNRRNIKDILVQTSRDSNLNSLPGSSIVLAKLEKPVRFR